MSLSARPLILSGPSGSGKSTLLNKLFQSYPNVFSFSVSHTTRSPRPGEIQGSNYHFVTKDEFAKLVEGEGFFIETAEFSGNFYGTSFSAVQDCTDRGRICVLDIEIQGVRTLKSTILNAHYMLIRPPTFEELSKRLISRQTESEESLKKRLERAKMDLDAADREGLFDVTIMNDDVERAYKEMESWIRDQYPDALGVK